MNLAEARSKNTYKEALAATSENWDEAGVGILDRDTLIGTKTLSRQLNTLIYLQIRTLEELRIIKKDISEVLEGPSSSKDYSHELEDITKKLSGLSLGKPETTPKASGARAKVYQDPYTVLKNIK
ncbi:putative protein [Badnavirus maculakalanchoes]|uniref:Uncharacterized protein n=1 Tax=Badnavirus maculakalanchoes TaxID=3051985 RepID=Q80QW5_9VIRU|nr:hypothetical protein [Badnavirus maculakalanchoes]AAO21219.1 putative protein [Badnavirus maculakalanchoes]